MKRVLVTGANKGIGRAIVAALLEHHPDVFVLLGSRDLGRGAEARAQLLAEHPGSAERVEVLELDVTQEASVAAAAARVWERFGPTPLAGLVNNAGLGDPHPMADILDVNTRGVHRVCEAFLPLIEDGGRVVNVTSASGPLFVADCSPERQAFFTDRSVTWRQIEALMDECLAVERQGGSLATEGLGTSAYGLSKACANSLTLLLAREHPRLTIHACTPGFIETDMTRPFAEARGVTPAEMGMKAPAAGTRAPLHLLLGEVEGSGHFYGSDAVRSPFDRYRSPGDPPHTGDP